MCPVRRVSRAPRGRSHPAEERGVVGQHHPVGVPLAQQDQHGRDPRGVGQDVLHAEAVHPDGGAGVHELTQVVEVLGVAAVPDHDPVRGDAACGEERELVAAVARRRVRVGGDGNAGTPVRGRRCLHHSLHVRGEALVIGDDLEHPGPHAGAGDAELDVADEQLQQGVGATDEPTGAVGLEVRRQRVGRVVARRGDQLHPGALGHPAHPRDVAAETEHREVDDRADPEVPQPFEPSDGGLDRDVLAPLGVGKVEVELRVADEHVLVDERRAQRTRGHRPPERLDLPRHRQPASPRMPS